MPVKYSCLSHAFQVIWWQLDYLQSMNSPQDQLSRRCRVDTRCACWVNIIETWGPSFLSTPKYLPCPSACERTSSSFSGTPFLICKKGMVTADRDFVKCKWETFVWVVCNTLDDKLWRRVFCCLDPNEPSFNKASLWRSRLPMPRVVPLSAQRTLAMTSHQN